MKQKLRNISRRGSYLIVAMAFFASWLGAVQFTAFADTFFNSEFANRILLLSSSSPGWSYTDGAGNSGTGSYAQPGSGPNGKQTAEQFNITTNSDNSTSPNYIRALTFQYCTSAAGNCKSPGNDGYASGQSANSTAATGDIGYTSDDANDACVSSCTLPRNADSVDGETSDLKVVFAGGANTSEAASTVLQDKTAGVYPAGTLIDKTTGQMVAQPNPTTVGGNFAVMWFSSVASGGDGKWHYDGGWSASVSNNENGGSVAAGTKTGNNNYITLSNSTGLNGGASGVPAGTPLEVVFFSTNTNYITNPGAKAFFVRMADYSDTGATTLMDGGVTVANVMTQSIQITTKVLETMSFSVGVEDPDTESGYTQAQYGGCMPLDTTNPAFPSGPANGIAMGDPTLEYSLDTQKPYDAYSLWRLSTNSAYGGTVYYSGDTLRSTEGSTITPLSAESAAVAGTNQFGLGMVDTTVNGASNANKMTIAGSTVTYPGKATYYDSHSLSANYIAAYVASQSTTDKWSLPDSLDGMTTTTGYGDAAGTLTSPATAQFDFNGSANTVPVAIAQKTSDVIHCATGQMRYLADIAGYTAAGIYTTKINYLAAPQY